MQYTFFLGVASAALLGAGALAMPQEPKVQGDKPMPHTQQPDSVHGKGMSCHKASSVIGTKVLNAQNASLGKVEDLVIDPTSGRIDYAVLSLDAKGSKDQWYAIPFGSLTTRVSGADMSTDKTWDKNGDKTGDNNKTNSPDRFEFILNVDATKLENAPGFQKDKWPDTTAAAWRMDLDKHYGQKRMGQSMPTDGAKNTGGSLSSSDAKANGRAIRASKLLDQNIVTTGDEKIGDIEELAIDTGNSRISYVVVSTGGFLGMGDKLHAIPWSAVRASPGTGKDAPENLVVDMTKDRLQKSPEFKKDEWARMSEPAWMNELYSYYGVSPYWSGKDTSGAREVPLEKNGTPRTDKGEARKDTNDPR